MRLAAVGVWTLSVLVSGCAVKRFAVPTDAGTPLPDYPQIHAEIAQACAGVRTLRGELRLSGRAGEERVRGTVAAGFERPTSMRLEGLAPFGGAPAFILVARSGEGTLVLPREGRILRDARPEDILAALTGVALAPADLQAILTGCLVPSPRPMSGRLHTGGLASIDLEGGATLYLRRSGAAWQLRAGRRDGWLIEYPSWSGAFPGSVRLQSSGSGVPVDLTATLSQIEANIELGPEAFEVISRDTTPLTLQELRDAGPLRGSP